MGKRVFDRNTGEPFDDVNETIKFSFFGDYCNDLDGMTPGDVVTVYFDVRGHEYEKNGTKDYFNELVPRKVIKQGKEPVATVEKKEEQKNFLEIKKAEPQVTAPQTQDVDPLPF